MNAKDHATVVVKRLIEAGYTAYFAGGWVRDFLMGHPSSDIDIATDAPPEKILKLFPKTIQVGLTFGVVIVSLEGHLFEVSTFRRDLLYTNGRKPEKIVFSSAQEDAFRRDFTINGMFYDPLTKEVIDYVGGREDLKRGVIRAIGDPYERFVEDRLRMIRAVRFASRFGFFVDPETENAVKENAETLFPAVAMERVSQELNKMADYPRFDAAMIEMHAIGLLSVIFPSLKSVGLNEMRKRVAPFPFYPKKTPLILYLLALFPDASEEEMIEVVRYLRGSNRDCQYVSFVFESRALLAHKEIHMVDWAHFYADPRSEQVLEVFAATLDEERPLFLQKHAARRRVLKPHIERIIQKKPVVSATRLQIEGIAAGKLLGELIREGEQIAIMQDLSDPDEIVQLLRQSTLWPKEGR